MGRPLGATATLDHSEAPMRLLPLLALLAPTATFAQTPCAVPVTVLASSAVLPLVVDAPADGAQHLGLAQGGALTRITGLRNGYAAVSGVATDEGAEVEGWLPLPALGLALNIPQGFATPDARAEVIWQGKDQIAPQMIEAYEACQGEWLSLRLQGQSAPVWVRGKS